MLNKNNLLSAKLGAKENSKYIISAVQVEHDATVVTDGHRMIIMSTPSDDPADFPETAGGPALAEHGPILIPFKDCLEIAKAISTKTKIPVLANAAVVKDEEKFVTIVTTDLDTERAFRIRKPEGNFPKWRGIVPKIKTDADYDELVDKIKALAKEEDIGGEISKAIRKLIDEVAGNCRVTVGVQLFAETFASLKEVGVKMVTISTQGASSALRLDGVIDGTSQLVTGIVMPMSNSSAEVPSWQEFTCEICNKLFRQEVQAKHTAECKKAAEKAAELAAAQEALKNGEITVTFAEKPATTDTVDELSAVSA